MSLPGSPAPDVPPHYRHTQIGWVLGGIIGTAGVLVVVLLTAAALWRGALVLLPVAVTVLILLLFGTLTVSVDRTMLEARFGLGLVRRRVALAEIRAFRVVRNRWYYGWGVRYFPGGWLYNVSGLSAVELRLADGRRVRIGTDEPDALRRALAQVLGEPPPPSEEERAADRRAARRYLLMVGLVTVAIVGVLAAIVLLHLRPPTAVVTADGFSVRSGLYAVEIPASAIESVDLEPAMPRVLGRPNGFALAGTLRGSFRLEGIGRARLFVHVGDPPYLVVRTREGLVVVNFRDPDRTRALYAALSALVG